MPERELTNHLSISLATWASLSLLDCQSSYLLFKAPSKLGEATSERNLSRSLRSAERAAIDFMSALQSLSATLSVAPGWRNWNATDSTARISFSHLSATDFSAAICSLAGKPFSDGGSDTMKSRWEAPRTCQAAYAKNGIARSRKTAPLFSTDMLNSSIDRFLVTTLCVVTVLRTLRVLFHLLAGSL